MARYTMQNVYACILLIVLFLRSLEASVLCGCTDRSLLHHSDNCQGDSFQKCWDLNSKQYSCHLVCNQLDKLLNAVSWVLITRPAYKVNGAFHNAIKSSLKYCLQLCRKGFSDAAANTCGMEILCQEHRNKNVINIWVTRAGSTLNNFNSLMHAIKLTLTFKITLLHCKST